MPEAARHLDEISHSHAKTGFLLGTLAAGIVGGLASWGLASALAGMACVFPFGTIAAIGIGIVVGVALIGPAGDFLQSTGEAVGRTFTYVTGTLNAIGSSNILINNRRAYRAHPAQIDFADCSDHPSPKHSPIIEGATTVWFNGKRAARVDDAVDCDAKISSGSDNVIIGSPPFAIAEKRSQEISNELRQYASYFRMGCEIIGGGLAGLKKGLPCFLADVGIGVGVAVGANAAGLNLPIPSFDYGTNAGNSFGTWLGNSLQGKPVHVPTGAKIIPFEDDFSLAGPMPLAWWRFYNSKDDRAGILGPGWVTPASLEFAFIDGELRYYGPQGRELIFEDLEPGEQRYYVAEQFQIIRSPGGFYFINYPSQGVLYGFGKRTSNADGERLPLKFLQDEHENSVSYEYDEHGLLRAISTSADQRVVLHYSGADARSARLVRVEQVDAAAPLILVKYRYNEHGDLAEVIDRLGHVRRKFTYQNHMMVSQWFASGLECNYEWDELRPEGRVIQHWTNDGEAYAFTYYPPDETGSYEVHCLDHLGRSQHWVCNADKLVTRYTNPMGAQFHLTWNADRHLLSHSLASGGLYRFAYDAKGQLATIQDPIGRTATLRWEDVRGKLVRLVDMDGSAWHCTYNEFGDLTEVERPDKLSEYYVYDDRGLPVLFTDAKGGHKRYQYNRLAQLTSYTDCSGSATTYEYDKWDQLARITNARGHSTELTRNALGQVLQTRTADDAHWQYHYTSAGLVGSVTDPYHRSTLWTHNTRGQLTTKQDAEKRRIELTYDEAHRLAALQNENGESFHFEYDAGDRLVEERRVGGQRVCVDYDVNGWPVTVVHHPGMGDDLLVDMESSSTNGLTPEIAGWGDGRSSGGYNAKDAARKTEFVRDAVGRLLEKRTAEYHYRYAYDAMDRLLSATKLRVEFAGEMPEDTVASPAYELIPLHASTFAYDVMGNLVAETATDLPTGKAHVLRHEHDPLGNRTQTALPSVPGHASQRALNFLHYGSGHLHQINLVHGSTDDDEQTSIHQTICDMERDELHQEVLRTQGRAQTRYDYDPVGRLTGAWTRSSSLVTQPFGLGQPGAAEWQQALDTLQQPAAASHPESRNLQGLLKAWRYDKVGEMCANRHSLHGDTGHQYDATGRILQTRRAVLGGVGNALAQAANESFHYDPAGNILDPTPGPVGSTAPQAPQRGFVRDNLVRVFEDKRYFYDGHGRLTLKLSGRHTRQHFQWNDENQLTEVVTIRRPGTEHETRQTTRFEYDAIGKRIAKRDAFGTTEFIWEGMRLIEERRGASVISYVYEPGSYVPMARVDVEGYATDEGGLGTTADAEAPGAQASQAVAARERFSGDDDGVPHPVRREAANSDMAEGGSRSPAPALKVANGVSDSVGACAVYYFHTDQVGMPQELSNAQGQLVWQASYKTWGSTVSEEWEVTTLAGQREHALDRGNIPSDENERQQNLRFQGQYLDRETGLHYNTFRYYDADIGRFICPDPIGLMGGINLNGYSPNPLAYIDPLGWDWNYYLTDANGNIYYHGRAADSQTLNDVMRRHGNNVGGDGLPRFGNGDSINRTTPVGTPHDTVRGIENNGTRNTGVLGRGGDSVRGNIDQGISDAKLRTTTGETRMQAAQDYLTSKGAATAADLKPIETKPFQPKNGC
ncbi:RHS repeat-associated core domain-containing protein [Diaphorobacter caeni]|uniref:RHS repeat-associated core domain-containing protein n=1 Tax=Diaphorobacter caeni TaxID=2784387 RepID=UPI00188FE902|nr:RHS repeat-associated core domain-containing protein [Diaphorobacter caeni]MBF5004445.1 RHS domain-containing protein [Diaphorobacter caeni]